MGTIAVSVVNRRPILDQIVLLLERLSSQIVEITVKIKKFQISTK
jgi:hypothetical protein